MPCGRCSDFRWPDAGEVCGYGESGERQWTIGAREEVLDGAVPEPLLEAVQCERLLVPEELVDEKLATGTQVRQIAVSKDTERVTDITGAVQYMYCTSTKFVLKFFTSF